MTKLPGFNLWIFRAPYEIADGNAIVVRYGWFVGHAPAGDIASGPHPSERHALRDAEAMTDTSGT